MLEIMLEPEVPFIELHGTVKIGDMDGHVIDTLEHTFAPAERIGF
jgi:hypothetical protein